MSRKILVKGRVNRGEVAALCGLVLAGVPYSYACLIIGKNDKLMSYYVDKTWRMKSSPRKRWKGAYLEEVKAVWDDPAMKTETIANLFDTSPDWLRIVARREGWSRRGHGGFKYNPKAIRHKPPHVQRQYRNLQRAFGSDAARKRLGL